jgi:hypothetical protein
MQLDRTSQSAAIIQARTSISGTAAQLYYYATQTRKKTWSKWLEQAGLNRGQVRQRAPRLKNEEILKALQALKYARIPLNKNSMIKNRTPEAAEIIEKSIGIFITPSQLMNQILHHKKNEYRNWNYWLKRLELDPNKIVRRMDNFPENMMIPVIQSLARTAVPLHATAVQNNKSESIAKLIYEETGYYLAPSQVYRFAVVTFKKPWVDWLKEAGVSRARSHPSPVRVMKRPKKMMMPRYKVHRAIRALYDAGYELNYSQVVHNHTHKAALIVRQSTGYYMTPGRLYRFAYRELGKPWDYWLVQAGLNPNEIRRRGSASYDLLSSVMKQELAAYYPETAKGIGFEGTGEQRQTVAIDLNTPEKITSKINFDTALDRALSSLTEKEARIFDTLLQMIDQTGVLPLEQIYEHLKSYSAESITSAEYQNLIKKISQDEDLKQHFLDVFSD